jgi:ankyrin repeat protein
MFKDKRYPKLLAACKSGDIKAVEKCLSPPIFRKIFDIEALGGGPLRVAAASGHPQIVSLLISKGVRVDSREAFRWQSYRGSLGGCVYSKTPLMLASIFGHLEVAQILIAKGADVNLLANTDADFEQYCSGGRITTYPREPCDTALLLAEQFGNHNIAKLLLDCGAKPGRCKEDGWL